MENIELNPKQSKHVDRIAMELVGFPHEEGRDWDKGGKDARYRSLFGAPLLVITALWQLIKNIVDDGYEIKHLLYGLVFLKVYAKNQSIHCAIVDWPTEKEFSSRAWHIIKTLSDQLLRVIKLENRFINAPIQDPNSTEKHSLLCGDCADFHIDEPSPWNKDWYSRKFDGPALKYFAACAIYSNNICYTTCPIPAQNHEGNFLDATILMELPDDEPIEVDSGPTGDRRYMGPQAGMTHAIRKAKSVLRSRQETLFSFFKYFNVLDTHFHHRNTDNEVMMENHEACFNAVAVITQVKFMLGVNTLIDTPEVALEIKYDML